MHGIVACFPSSSGIARGAHVCDGIALCHHYMALQLLSNRILAFGNGSGMDISSMFQSAI